MPKTSCDANRNGRYAGGCQCSASERLEADPRAGGGVAVACGDQRQRVGAEQRRDDVRRLGAVRERDGAAVQALQADALHFSTDVWVNFKLFGGMGLMLAFVIAQALWLAKYVEEDPVKVEVDPPKS